MNLTGKTINFLGDSITEGCCATAPELGFVERMHNLYQLAAARNYGIGGTRIARQQVSSEIAQYDLDFCSRIEEMDPDADIVVAFGGTNDHGHGDAPIGTPADRTPDSFYGACHYLYAELLNLFPQARIVVLTPLHRAEETREKDDITLEYYVNIIKEIAAQYQLPVLDLYNTSAIRAHIPENAAALTTDGLHPNDAGHEILAKEIGAFLQRL